MASQSLAGHGSSQSVSDVEEVIYVSLRVVLQQLDIGGEISNQEPLPDKDEHSTAYPQQRVRRTFGIAQHGIPDVNTHIEAELHCQQ